MVLRPHCVGPHLHQRGPESRAGGHGPAHRRSIPTRPYRTRRTSCARSTWPAIPMRETNLAAVNAQLTALGHDDDLTQLPPRRPAVARRDRRSRSRITRAHRRHQRHAHQLRRRDDRGARRRLPGDVGLGRLRPPGRQPRARPGRGRAAGRPGTDGRRPRPPGGRLAARERRGPVARGRQPDPVGPPPGLGDQDRLPQRRGRRPRRLAAGAGRRLHRQLHGPEPVVLPPAQRPLHRRPHADPLRQRQHAAGQRSHREQPRAGVDARRDRR